MLRKILLPTILIILGYGFWVSPDFKVIAAGVSIFLFGMLSLEEGFKAFSGGTLENILRKSTDKLYKSIGFGLRYTLQEAQRIRFRVDFAFGDDDNDGFYVSLREAF